MSLVAYGASDDSEQSDTEENNLSPNKKERGDDKNKISDDEDDYQTVSSSSSSAIFSNHYLDIINKSDSSFTVSSSVTSHQGLPPPKKREEITIEETELEEEVRQKPSELADAPKPPKKTKQPVKIKIPSLNEIPDEEGDTNKQRPAASSVRSGLFSLLPAPIHSAKKEINRPLIPHSLGKKTLTSKPAAVQAKSVSSSNQADVTANPKATTTHPTEAFNKNNTAYNSLTGYDSDDNDSNDKQTSSKNFFSLGSTNKEVDSVSSTTENGSSEIDKNGIGVEKESSADNSNSPLEEKPTTVQMEPGLTNDSPLDFGNASSFSSWSSASSSYLGGVRPNHQLQESGIYYSSHPQSSVQYNMVDASNGGTDNVIGTELSSNDLQQMMNDKEFQKLHGKRKRGLDEAISFVDAKVDDYVDPSELSKYITEESEYTSAKNKEDMPTSQQKRKKQITYLAFQAKEKEMELKNTWSQNKLTKRQTQAKYGF